jgi:hypothetical protein
MNAPAEFVQALHKRRDTWLFDAEARKAGINNERRIEHDAVSVGDEIEHRVTVLWGFEHKEGQGHSYDYALEFALTAAGVDAEGVQS